MSQKKEQIKRRMVRNASKVWGYKGTQPEESFDPIVGLLMGAYASELEKVYNDISDSETRIIERLVQIFTPEPIVSIYPSHAIAHIQPDSDEVIVGDSFHFFHNKKTGLAAKNKKSEKAIFFTPAGDFPLIDGSIKYLAARDTIYNYSSIDYKEEYLVSENNELNPNSLYLGLHLENLELLPKSISIFFNVLGDDLKNQFLDIQLPNSNFYIGDTKLNTKSEINRNKKGIEDEITSLVKNGTETSTKVTDHIIKYYNRHFVTINLKDLKGADKKELTNLPNEFARVFSEKDIQKFEKEKLLWIELKFSQVLSFELLENLNSTINCVPIVNRQLNEFSSSARKVLNIIPLQTDDVFLDLKTVLNKKGLPYKVRFFSNLTEMENGQAILRSGGVGRYDSRDAKQHIDYLVELLKDESTAFNILGTDMITSDLKKLDQAIARLEKKVKEINLSKSETSYLFLKPSEKNDLVFIEFWTSNGEFGNSIKAGTKLQTYKARGIQNENVKLITPTIGGKDKPGPLDKVNIYRKALLSRGKLITEVDYKSLCYEYFGDLLKNISIKKGTMNDLHISNGLVRTIDLHITLKDASTLPNSDIEFFKNELLVILKQNSSNIFPFRVYIK